MLCGISERCVVDEAMGAVLRFYINNKQTCVSMHRDLHQTRQLASLSTRPSRHLKGFLE